ncbi:MAG: hypothetical protein ACREP6_09600, partial [Candidatus Binataceae bacterium]
YQDLTAQPVTPSPAREGRKWVVDDVDIVSCLRYFRDGKLTIRQWLDSHRGVEERAFFSRDDPWPLAAAYAMDAREVMRGIFGKAHRRRPLAAGVTPAAMTPSDNVSRGSHRAGKQTQLRHRAGAANLNSRP